MKKIAITAAALATLFAGAPAFAQNASGKVDVTGTVAAKCAAVTPITGSITLGELANANGTIDAAFGNNTGGLARQFTVRCNGANPQISVNAKALVNAAAVNTPAGYTNIVNYTATLTANTAKGGSTSVADLSSGAGATTGLIGDRIAAAANNVTLAVSAGNTADAAAILEAGSYAGSVDIIISPAA